MCMKVCMRIGQLIPIRELMLLVKTDKWSLDVSCAEDEKGYLSITKRFLCNNETGERWELKSFGLYNDEQVAEVIGVEKRNKDEKAGEVSMYFVQRVGKVICQ